MINTLDTATNVIFIDDEEDIRSSNLQSLNLAGFIPQAFASADAALEVIRSDFGGVIVSDIRMPGMDGLALFRHLSKLDEELPVILISGHSDIPTAVDAVQRGAYDFLSKPFSPDRLTESVSRALKTRMLVLENRRLKQDTKANLLAGPLLGESNMMENLRRTIDQISDINVSVLIEGETGTGKGLIASMLHKGSSRRNRQMTTIDCGALPDVLVDSELFGHVSGAFAGAATARVGSLERANRSSLFLDSADSMPDNVQKKFELALDRREITPLGANTPRSIDVRIITASQKDLNKLVEAGHFSASLYYRLNGITLKIPPLRQRREDISILFGAFLSSACDKFKCPIPKLTPAYGSGSTNTIGQEMLAS